MAKTERFEANDMEPEIIETKIKTVHQSGQISIGKELGGRHAKVERFANGQILITPVDVIPSHHKVFFTDAAKIQLEEFNDWENEHSPAETSVSSLKDEMLKRRSGRKRGEKKSR